MKWPSIDHLTSRAVIAFAAVSAVLALQSTANAQVTCSHDDVNFDIANPDPTPWLGLGTICAAPGDFDCWHIVQAVQGGVAGPNSDNVVTSDESHKANPQPPSSDLYDGGEGVDEPTLFYGYSPNCYDNDMDNLDDNPLPGIVYFRMRLSETASIAPTGQTPSPGEENSGPFSGNTAWNFLLDLNGDGWADFLSQVDGNTGSNPTPKDDYRLAYANTPGNQSLSNDDLCTDGGQVFQFHDSNVIGDVITDGVAYAGSLTNPGDCIEIVNAGTLGFADEGDVATCRFENGGFDADGTVRATPLDYTGNLIVLREDAGDLDLEIPGCSDENDPVCNYTYVRLVNTGSSTTDSSDFYLDMQFPLEWFDTCEVSDGDGDVIGGVQELFEDTTFAICASTSTQPNDFVNKDLSFNGTYAMSDTTPLPCGAPCSLSEGCIDDPTILGASFSCPVGMNPNPVTITASVFDAGDVSGGTVISTIDTVTIAWRPSDANGTPLGSGYTDIVVSGGSANPIIDPDTGTIDQWTLDWDTSSLPMGTTWVLLRITAVDDQGNISVTSPEAFNVVDCSNTTTPVTIAFVASSKTSEGQYQLNWMTDSETGNLGFNVYADSPAGLMPLSKSMVPSNTIDSLEPQSYSLMVNASDASNFYIEEVSVKGEALMSGPYQTGSSYGRPVEAPAVNWQAARKSLAPESLWSQREPAGNTSFAELRISSDGIYRVSYDDLVAAGFPVDNLPRTQLAVTLDDRAVARRIFMTSRRVDDGLFGPGDIIEFVGRARQSLYGDENVYQIRRDGRLVESIGYSDAGDGTPVESYTASMRVEQNNSYQWVAPTGDPWYFRKMVAYEQASSYAFDFSVDNLTGNGSGSIQVTYFGVTDYQDTPQDHHIQWQVNGLNLAEDVFDGVELRNILLQLPAGTLHEGVNTLTAIMPADTGVEAEVIGLEAFVVNYQRALVAQDGQLEFDYQQGQYTISGFSTPDLVGYHTNEGGTVSLIGKLAPNFSDGNWQAQFVAPLGGGKLFIADSASMQTPSILVRNSVGDLLQAADYLIVSHPAFISGLDEFIAAKQAQGFTVAAVSTDDIYQAYGAGQFDAAAIQAFVSRMIERFGTSYVLLVGGDTVDYHDYLGRGSISFVPAPYAATSELIQYAPLDALFVDIDNDLAPDARIGRWPVHTTEELAIVIDKTLNFDGTAQDALFVNDRGSIGTVNFATHAATMQSQLPDGWLAQRLDMNIYPSNGDAANLDLISALDQGPVIAGFVGHTGFTAWGQGSVVLSHDDVANLSNFDNPSVFVQFGCWNTWVQRPGSETIGRALLVSPGAAAAAIGSSTRTQAISAKLLSERVMPLLTERGMTVGEAMLRGKLEMAARRPDLVDAILGWSLLGDPSLIITE